MTTHRTTFGSTTHVFDDLKTLLAKASSRRSGDELAGLAAANDEERMAARFALADVRGIDRFALVGHDWGGAIAWAAAIGGSPRIERLAIINSPHPMIFQRSLIDDPAQRAASQYMNAFRTPGMEQGIARMGLETFFRLN